MRLLTYIIIAIFVFWGCENSVESNSDNDYGNYLDDGGGDDGNDDDSTDEKRRGYREGDWLVSVYEIYDGGPGKDGIPALEEPDFVSVSETVFMENEDLVIAVKRGNDVRIYPMPILDWHEIINDSFHGEKMSITYCPLTGSGINWERVVDGVETTFGVSGLLYNSNLIPYDRFTNTNYSQMMNSAINGEKIGDRVKTLQMIETEWSTIKEFYPSAEVVSTNTDYKRPYGSYPYGDYKTNHNALIFPVNNSDDRLPGKERVLGVEIDGSAKAYPFSRFENLTMVNQQIGSVSFVVVGDRSRNYLKAFNKLGPDGKLRRFEIVEDEFPIVMKDTDGNRYDVFGIAVSGPDEGLLLKSPNNSYMAYWFAWAAFNHATELF